MSDEMIDNISRHHIADEQKRMDTERREIQAALERDANRYRWLRDAKHNGTISFGPTDKPWACTLYASPTMAATLDESIDAIINEDARIQAARTAPERPNA